MENLSKDVWKEIQNNQNLPLFGSTIPFEGNGFHDAISWGIPFHPRKEIDDEFQLNNFHSIYLRDLGLLINPSYNRNDKFKNGIKITNCSDYYYKTLLKYFTSGHFPQHEDILDKLGEWGTKLSYNGRLVFEIVGWYDNKSSQFYGYKLNQLDIDYCKFNRKNIIYNAPFELEKNREVFKKVKIPKSKCIIIDFPKELGGYKGYLNKRLKIKKIGNKLKHFKNPGDSLTHMENWDKKFNEILSDWGASNKIKDVTEFYQAVSRLRFTYMAILCTHEILKGFENLIKYLNSKLQEDANLELNIKEYNKNYFKTKQEQWMRGELSFKEVNELLRL